MEIPVFGRWYRRVLVSVSAVCAAALVVSGLPSDQAWGEDPPVEPSPEVSAPVSPETVDFPSAVVQARATGERVEVTAERTDSSTTWVNPDGTVTTTQHAAPVRFQDGEGAWQEYDTTLVEQEDGSIAPAAVPDGVVLAGEVEGSSAEPAPVAEVGAGEDASVAVAWEDSLPAPVLEGSAATYQGAWPGIDLVVHATRDGFEQSFVISDREALLDYVGGAPAASDGGGEPAPSDGGGAEPAPAYEPGVVSWDVPLQVSDGLTAREAGGERIEFVDGDEVVVSTFEAPLAWDASVDEASREHLQRAGVSVAIVEQSGTAVTLRLGVEREWLLDDSRVFPVTVDPVYAKGTARPSFDAFVQTNYSSDRSSEQELKVGTYDGTNKARSFLTFSNTAFKDVKVQSATLNLYETWSYSCTASAVEVWNSGSVSTATRWTNQPALGTKYGSVTVAKGANSSCKAGWVNIPITSLAQSWSTNAAASVTLALKAGSETNVQGWKRFGSMESTTPPSITFTYNRKPNLATAPTVAGAATSGKDSFVPGKRPVLSSTATDPDGNRVKTNLQVHTSATATATTLVAKCTTPLGASGSTLSCTPDADLPDNKTLYVRASVADELGLSNGGWSTSTVIKTAQATPAKPTITCGSTYTNGGWVQTPPSADVTCTVTAPATTGNNQAIQLDARIDGNVKAEIHTVTAGKSVTVKLPKTEGGHQIRARVYTASRLGSDAAVFATGWGGPSLLSPGPLAASNGKFQVQAMAPPRTASETTAVTAQMQWRLAGTNDAWTNAGTATNVTAPLNQQVKFTSTFDAAAALAAAGNTSRAPVRMQFQVCFSYTGVSAPSCTGQTQESVLVRIPHAFGGGYPTTDVEAGQVALYTGEFQTTATDVTVPGYGSNLTLERSHLSYTGTGDVKAWPTDPVTGVFGPGFTANLEGDDAVGLAGMDVIDQRMSDGTIALLDEEGEALVFVNATGKTGTVVGALAPGTEDTELSGVSATLTGTAAAPSLVVTESDGTKTTFVPVTGGASKNLDWRPASIAEPGQAGSTTFGHNPTTGVVTRIVAPLPDGLSGTACPTSGTLQPGCRAIDLSYTTVTDPNGKQVQRLTQVSAVMYNAGTKTVESQPVTRYTYDSLSRLSTVTDVRSNLSTTYTWEGSTTRIKTITPSGLAGYTLNYAANPDASVPTQVVKNVQRGAQTSGGPAVQIASIVYNVPVSGTGLPNLSEDGIAAWVKDDPGTPEHLGQKPVNGYAVFGPDKPVTALVGTGVSAADLQYADLQYINSEAYTVNTASYGAGAWQITATRYDDQGNVTRELDATAIQTAIADPALDGPQVDDLGTRTVFNDEKKDAAGTVILPAGSVVTETFGPARTVMLADGSTDRLRPHTLTTYDEGAPNGGVNPVTGQAYALPTTVTVNATDMNDGVTTVVEEVSKTTNGYAPIDGKALDDPTSGWVLGVPTTVTDAAGKTTKQRFDARGKVLETRMPASNGSDAGTTKTIYYTAGANSSDASCGASDQAKAWAGELCRTYPAAAPSSGPTLPSTKVTGYDYWLAPTTTVETSGSATRTSEVKYDAAGRAVWENTSTSGVAGSVATEAIFTQYNPTTGLVDAVGIADPLGTGIGGAKDSFTYDLWGKETSYTNQLGEKTSTSYDTAARVTSIADPKGTTTFAYDGTDANGKPERRGVVTTQSVTRTGAEVLTYTAAYDPSGAMTTEKLPGGITVTHHVDEAGEEVGLTYAGQLTDPDTGDVTTGDWIAWSQTNDILGRVRTDQTTFASAIATTAGILPDGGTTDGEMTEPTGGNPLDLDHRYTYDKSGNLAKVEDLTGTPVEGSDVSPYTVRDYTFTTNGARKSVKETIRADGTPTGAATTGIDQTLTYDTADRLTGGYVYDPLGRQTTLPAAHAPNPAGGDVQLGYFDNDLPQKVAQDGTTTTFTLDVAKRRLVQSSDTGGEVTTTTRHYTDSSDNPSWIETKRPDGSTETLRYTSSISGDLGASIATDGGVSLMLPNIHDDITTTIPIPAGTPATTAATTIAGWSSYTEYGTPIDPAQTATAGTSAGYGWLGAKERSTTAETANLTLMGVRYYNRITGSFTSPDPIPGANATAYNYPTDPINFDDTSGERPRMRHDGGGIGGSAGGGRRVGGGKVTVRVPLYGKASYARANKAFDVPKQSGVYVVHFKSGHKYVGRSNNMYRRIGEHQNRGKFDKHGGISKITFSKKKTSKSLRQQENDAYWYWRGVVGEDKMDNIIKPCRHRQCR